jgi:hypothetical protein
LILNDSVTGRPGWIGPDGATLGPARVNTRAAATLGSVTPALELQPASRAAAASAAGAARNLDPFNVDSSSVGL